MTLCADRIFNKRDRTSAFFLGVILVLGVMLCTILSSFSLVLFELF